ncbi:BON domain-containing protein [Leisingera sp.]|uniref:BON domain-containing protein n=1 Tax=Leisingera sp. TaxID=1879318 RepID=UPI002B270507|nr:BON domain-containing protein [Leisingera sp.]
MKDATLRREILEELELVPSIDAANIGVSVEDGIATLTGHVAASAQKQAIGKTVNRVSGVHGIVMEIEVRPIGEHLDADDEIAKRAIEALRWIDSVPKDTIRVEAEHGILTLTGQAGWSYEKAAAERAVQKVSGVKEVINLIKVTSAVSHTNVRMSIETALRKDAASEAKGIHISIDDHSVTLTGSVRTKAERDTARRAVWAVPGVSNVVDGLTVEP